MSPRLTSFVLRLVAIMSLGIASCFAQFSGSIQGTVQDPAGGVVPNAKVDLKNTETGVVVSTNSNTEGNYRFVSLAPGAYQITVAASGFNTSTATFRLETAQNLNLPIPMKV